MSDVGAVWAAMEPFCSDFGRWLTVIIHSENLRLWYIPHTHCVHEEHATVWLLALCTVAPDPTVLTYTKLGHLQS